LIVVLLILVPIGILVAVVLWTRAREQRIDFAVADTVHWLEAEATIQIAGHERIDKYTSWPGFAFSYLVNGAYQSGKFFLKADSEQSDELVRDLPGRRFPVQYDPDDPSSWYVEQSTMDGFEIVQKLNLEYPADSGPYRSDGGEPIDPRLNG